MGINIFIGYIRYSANTICTCLPYADRQGLLDTASLGVGVCRISDLRGHRAGRSSICPR